MMEKTGGGPNTELYGVALLLASLALDGLCGPSQERIHAQFPCSNLAFMFINNFHAMFLVGIPLILTSQLFEGVRAYSALVHLECITPRLLL